jgi:putative (di)nucleoside polyphosphate hydrolase
MAIFQRLSDSCILICERSTPRGNWQFPQGGLDFDESPEDALFREMKEEIGTKNFRIVKKKFECTRYDFPSELSHIPIAHSYRGQIHTWFLCEFFENCGPDLDNADDEEFIDHKFVSAQEALSMIVEWKKPAMERGLRELGLLDEPS